ncbi:TPA: hypothetical protein ACIVUJ_004769 [Salmonella enterica subsp. enterica serovar Thompson]
MNSTSAENLPSLTHNHLPVITTELLAELYGTERQRLTNMLPVGWQITTAITLSLTSTSVILPLTT